MRKSQRSRLQAATFSLLLLISASVVADDAADLQAMLDAFLSGVTEADTHDRFWAEDLIYTSSRGTRTTKADIMSGFTGADEGSSAGGPEYSAEDVQIQVYGNSAIVAFRLVASPEGDTSQQEYLNTGTFLKRNNEWSVVAWQATMIPETIIPAQ